jgi:hypothetical protein
MQDLFGALISTRAMWIENGEFGSLLIQLRANRYIEIYREKTNMG